MSMIKNSTWNILGVVIPSAIALPTMGVLSRLLGVEQFGLFTLAFAIVGYATLFDAGLSRAVIRAVAMHQGDRAHQRRVMGTASGAVIALSLLATALLWCGAARVVALLGVSPEYQAGAVSGFRWLSLCVPPFLLATVWFAYLEGNERFGEFNVLRTLSNSLLAIAPLLAVLVQPTFTATVIGLVIARLVAMALAYWPLHRAFPEGIRTFELPVFKELLRFGSWMTVSNIVSPLMVYVDRFVLSHMVGAGRVSFYTAPAEAVTRMLIIPNAVARVVFPLLSRSDGTAAREANRAFWGLLAISLALVLPILVLAPWIMTLWMGPEYGGDAAQILRILAVGFVFNALAQIPFAKIQAKGHSRTTAFVHLAELLPYLALLVLCIQQFAILGAAIAWTLRVTADYIALEFFARRLP